MPIVLPETLPATATLRAEGVRVIAANQAPPRVLQIGLVNLMPDKPTTETQLARLLGAAPQASRLSLFWPQGENSRRTPAEHLEFYEPLEAARDAALDGLIITGAPVEQKPFREVRYWPTLAVLYDHVRARGIPTLNICWAAMAALHHYREVPKRGLPAKAFGVFDQALLDPSHALMQGMPRSFPVPVSRHAHVTSKAIAAAGAVVLAASSETGASVAYDAGNRAALLFDHFEYDAGTLLSEFLRDRQAALPTQPPSGLALGGAAAVPWRASAHLLFRNWLAEVEALAQARHPRDLLDWLLAIDGATGSGETLVVIGSASPAMLAAVAGAAAKLDVPLSAMRRHVVDGTEAVAATLQDGVAEAVVERLAKLLLAIEGARRVLRRDPGVSGASLFAQEMERAA
jgi:homoserine O-succinyltransferase